MASTWDQLQLFGNKTIQTILSVVKVILFSRRLNRKLSTIYCQHELVVLGNGPSLLNTINKHSDFLNGKDLLAVNFAATSEYFEIIKPNLYLAIDPAFFENEEYCNRLFGNLASKTNWQMALFLPYKARNRNNWKKLISSNKHISVFFVNTTPIEGFKWFTHLAFNIGWGMPRPRNVLIPAIMQGLRMSYKTIYVAGADHSWPKQVAVDDLNRVYEDLRHFYSENEPSNRHYFTKRLDEILESMVVAFRSYHYIEAYGRALNKKIYNITEGSYIDAFERKKL